MNVTTMKTKIILINIFILLYIADVVAQCGSPVLNQGTITPLTTTQNTATINSGRPYWQFTATSGCEYTFTTCGGTSVDTYLRLYNSSWTLQASNDDVCGLQSTITWTAPANGTYYILLTEWSCASLSGNAYLTYSTSCGIPGGPPANDDCSGATFLTLDECNWKSYVLPKEATNSGVADPGCLQPSGIGCGSGTVVEDIWYRFTANSSTTIVEAINNNRHMAIQVYSGTCGSLTPVSGGCSDNCPSPESVSIGTNPGQTYYVRLMRTNGDGVTNDMDGTIRVYSSNATTNQGFFGSVTANNSRGSAPTLTLTAANSCSDVGNLKSGKIEIRNLSGATSGDFISSQSCFTIPNISSYKNVWAEVSIANGSGIEGFYFYSSTEGICPQPSSSTNLRTAYIQVYDVTTCTPSLVCGGTWDNVITDIYASAPHIRSVGTTRVDVNPGKTYRIEISTTTASTDPDYDFDVFVVPVGAAPSNSNCSNAISFTNQIACNLGGNPGCNTDIPNCAWTIENSVFYSFVKPVSGSFDVTISNVDCEGGGNDLQSAIYRASTINCNTQLNSFGNQIDDQCFTGSYTYTINNADPIGTEYIIWFDGNAGAACKWGIQVTDPLPVELLSFSAQCSNGKPLLEWSTASELNNDYFTIEKSLDGLNFEVFDYVSGQGNSNSTTHYSWKGESALYETEYYRLKQTDYNGDYKYLGTKAINCKLENQLLIYPNPTDNDFTVLLPDDYIFPGTIQVFDNLGRIVFEKEINDNSVKVVLNESAALGTYFVKVYNQSNLFIERVVKGR